MHFEIITQKMLENTVNYRMNKPGKNCKRQKMRQNAVRWQQRDFCHLINENQGGKRRENADEKNLRFTVLSVLSWHFDTSIGDKKMIKILFICHGNWSGKW